MPDPNGGNELFRNGEPDTQRIHPHDHGDFHPLRHVITDRDETLRNHPVEGRTHNGVGKGLLSERNPGPGALQRLIQLCGAVPGGLVLLARRVHLRASLLELGLRHHVLVEERLDPAELAFRERVGRFRVAHLRHGVDVERPVGGETKACFDLRGVGFRLFQLRFGFCGRQTDQFGARCHARAELHGSRHDASGSLGGDFRLLLGCQRAAGTDKTRDGLFDGCHGDNGNRLGR